MAKKKKWYEMSYSGTKLTVEATQIHISTLLKKYGIVDVQHTTMGSSYIIRFLYNGQGYQLNLELTGKESEQQQRQKFRAFYWYMKTRLEALEFGITTFEKEFISARLITMANGAVKTVGDIVEEQSERLTYGQSLWLPYKKD